MKKYNVIYADPPWAYKEVMAVVRKAKARAAGGQRGKTEGKADKR